MSGAPPLSLPQTALLPQLATLNQPLSLPMLVVHTSENLASVDRPLSINGTLIGLLENGTLQLQTNEGLIRLALLKTDRETQRILNDFLLATGPNKPSMEIVLQAGSPPKQALLVLPQADAQRVDAKQPVGLPQQTAASLSLNAPVFQKGQTLTISLLPDDIDHTAITKAPRENVPPHAATKEPQIHLPRFVERALNQISETAGSVIGKSHVMETLGLAKIEHKASTPAPALTSPDVRQQPFSAQTMRLRIDHVFTPDTPWPEMMQPAQIKATVINKSQSGHLLIASEGKTIFVHQTGTLKEGSKLIATPLALDDLPATTIPRRDQRDFPPLRDMMAALEQANSQTAASFLNVKLPTPFHHMAGTLLFLFSALQKGTLEEWLGPAIITHLERVGKKQSSGDLLSTLENTMTQTVRDPAVGEWRAYPLPLHYIGSYDMLRLYVHHDEHKNTRALEADKPDKTRFIITMNMSRLGSMQLDGLSQPKKLDLIIRSEAPLPYALTHELRETTTKTLEATGLNGSLTFQTGRQNWMVFQKTESKDWIT